MNSVEQSAGKMDVATAVENLGALICVGLIFLALGSEKGASQFITFPFGICVINGLLGRVKGCNESDDE